MLLANTFIQRDLHSTYKFFQCVSFLEIDPLAFAFQCNAPPSELQGHYFSFHSDDTEVVCFL